MNTSPVPLLPRADVSTGALAGALVGLLMLFVTDSANVAQIGVFAVVIITFAIEYLVPSQKIIAGAIAGALVVVGTGIYSLAVELPLDEAAFQSAAVYLVTLVLTAVIPSSQPPAAEPLRDPRLRI